MLLLIIDVSKAVVFHTEESHAKTNRYDGYKGAKPEDNQTFGIFI